MVNKLIWANDPDQLPPGAHCHLLLGLKQGYPFAQPQRPVYPGPLGWANQLAQILVQEVCHACSA